MVTGNVFCVLLPAYWTLITTPHIKKYFIIKKPLFKEAFI